MPRLTNNLYLERGRFLRKAWADIRAVFSVVSIAQQWDVHRYFQTQAELTASELLEHRAQLTAVDPSLPQRAGKASAQIYRAFCYAYHLAHGDEARFFQAILDQVAASDRSKPRTIAGGRGSSIRTISVRALARPEPDVKLLAKAFLGLSEQHVKRDAERDEPDAA